MKNYCLYLAKELRSQIIKLINQYQEDIFANDSKLEEIYSQYRAKAIDMAGISTAQITQAVNHLGLSNRIFQADPPRIKGTWEQSTYEAILNIHARGKICMKFHANGMPYVQDFGKEKAIDTDKLTIKNLRKEPYIERNTFYAGDQKHKLSHVIMPYSMAKILDLASFYRLITNIDDEALAVSVSEECHILFDDNELTYEEMKEKIEQKLNEICIEDDHTFTP